MKYVLTLICLTLAAPSFAARETMEEFKQCNGWLEQMESKGDRVDDYDNDLDNMESEIDRLESVANNAEKRMSSAEMWMGMQEAVQDWDGYNRNVNIYNDALNRAKRAHNERNNLIDSFYRKQDRRNNLVEDINEIDERFDKYCVGQWPTPIVESACNSYDDNTEEMCDTFED